MDEFEKLEDFKNYILDKLNNQQRDITYFM
jgi:hypothetical protein